MQEKKKNRGITLIALIITIIVLLILSGLSIQLIKNKRLLEQAKQAELESKRGKIAEWLNLKLIEEQVNNPLGTAEDIIKATRQNVIEHKKELEKMGKDISIEEMCNEEDGETVDVYFYVVVDKDLYKVDLRGAKYIGKLNITLGLSDTSGTVVDGESKTATIIGKNYGTLTVTSSDESIATASISGDTLTVTGTIASGTNIATITVSGSEGGSATYTVTAHKHTGDSVLGGGCYGIKNEEKVSCGGTIVAKSESYTYTCEGWFYSPSCGGTAYAESYDGTNTTYRCSRCGWSTTSYGNAYAISCGGTTGYWYCNRCGTSGSGSGRCSAIVTGTNTVYKCNTCGNTYSSTGTCTAVTRDEVYYSKNCGY